MRRTINAAGHSLAKLALHYDEECVWYNDCPSCILGLVLADQARL